MNENKNIRYRLISQQRKNYVTIQCLRKAFYFDILATEVEFYTDLVEGLGSKDLEIIETIE